MVIVLVMMLWYYIIVLVWVLYYFVNFFYYFFLWFDCSESWNIVYCIEFRIKDFSNVINIIV